MATAERALVRAAALLAVVALAATACGAAAGASAGRPHPAPAARPASPEALRAVQVAAAGALATTAAVSIELAGATVLGGGRSPVDAAGTFDLRSLRGALTLVSASGKVREPVVFAPTAVYVRPPAGAGLPRGKSWLVADFSDPEALDASFPKLVAQVESLDPALTLSELAWGAAAAAPAGSETVRGRSADRYDVTVDLNRAVASVSGPGEVPFGRAIASEIVARGGSVTAGAAPPATLAARVWVAGGQLARVDLSPPGAGLGAMSLALTGFGVPVPADPPPRAQVVDVLALAPSGERENQNGGDSDGG
jgi:hypothetical protein